MFPLSVEVRYSLNYRLRSALRSNQPFIPVRLPTSCRSVSENARSPQISMLRFPGMLTLTPKPKKAPARKQGQAMSELFLLVKHHPAVDQQ